MKRVIQFSRAYWPTVIVSLVLILTGIVGYVVKGGFNLGVDFQAGLMQQVQFAPSSFSMTYSGKGNASVSLTAEKLEIIVSGSDVEKATYSYPFAAYPSVGSIVTALASIEGLSVVDVKDSSASSSWLIQSAQQNPQLGSNPATLHFLKPGSAPIAIATVRAALSSISGSTIQELGNPSDRMYMIRVEDSGLSAGFVQDVNAKISAALTASFGAGNVAVISSNYVGSRFSKDLTDQVFFLVFVTLLVILIYCGIRFKPRYAMGAVLSVVHDALIMVSFMAWSRMEFTTSSIAAILTILGYSINDTIVNYDRIRECVHLYPDAKFKDNLNRGVSETLGRTIITTGATLITVLALFFFTTGSMKDFALLLIVGMLSGVYSTIYIASAFVYSCDWFQRRKAAKKLAEKQPPVKA